jgi:hypothetical protein
MPVGVQNRTVSLNLPTADGEYAYDAVSPMTLSLSHRDGSLSNEG